VLATYVGIRVAVGDLAAACVAAEELSEISGIMDAPFLHVITVHAAGQCCWRGLKATE
jgi:hypothetical protein